MTAPFHRTTEQFHSFDSFAEAVMALPIPWRLSTRESQYSAHIDHCEIGPISLGRVEFGPCLAAYPHSCHAEDSRLCMTVQITGQQNLVWSDCEIQVSPGEIVLWDNSKPMKLDNRVSGSSYNLWMPVWFANRRVGDVSNLMRNKLSCDNGVSHLLGANVKALFDQFERIPERSRLDIVDAMLDLLFTGFVSQHEEKPGRELASDVVDEAISLMRDASDLCDITVTSIAHELGVSVRFLQLQFASKGLTFSGSLASIRLGRAGQALRSSRFRSFTVTDIAHWFGFYDASHFNRAFKRHYGMTPSAYRCNVAIS